MKSIKDFFENEGKNFKSEEIEILMQTEEVLAPIHKAWMEENKNFYDIMEVTIEEEVYTIIDDYNKSNEPKEQKKNEKVDR